MRCHLMIVCLLVPSILIGCGPAPSGPSRVYHRQDGSVTKVTPSQSPITRDTHYKTTRYGSEQEYQSVEGQAILLSLAAHAVFGLIELVAAVASSDTPSKSTP